MILKVCGMREPGNISAIEELQAGYGMPRSAGWMGFIFWPKSSRYVAAPPAYLPQRVRRIGVFVDAPLTDVIQHVADYGLYGVQLHGHETPEYVQSLRAAVSVTVIKAFCISTSADLEATSLYSGLADYFLFDAKGPSAGGNGTQYDWSMLNAYQGPVPFLLSGGIGPDDAQHISDFRHPYLAGIDLNSRFEHAPALKDIHLLTTFMKSLQSLSLL